MSRVHSFGSFEHAVDLGTHGKVVRVDGTDSASFALTLQGVLIGWGLGLNHELEADDDARARREVAPWPRELAALSIRVVQRGIAQVACAREEALLQLRGGFAS